MYETDDGRRVPKPLYVQNESEVYTQVLEYLEARGLDRLREQITPVSSTRELEAKTKEYFLENRPLPRAERDRTSPREHYFDIPLPHVDIKDELPKLLELGASLEIKRSEERGLDA